jgi:hypothetical protein
MVDQMRGALRRLLNSSAPQFLMAGIFSQYRWPPVVSPAAFTFGGVPSRSTLPLLVN